MEIDEKLMEKLNFIKKAQKTIEALTRAGSKATLKISLVDRIYFKIQEIFGRKNTKLLTAGTEYINSNNENEKKPWELTQEEHEKINPEVALINAQNQKETDIDITK